MASRVVSPACAKHKFTTRPSAPQLKCGAAGAKLGATAPDLYPALHYPIAIRETAGSMEKCARLGVYIDPHAARISNPV